MASQDDFPSYFRQIQVKFSRLYAHVLQKTNLTLPQYALLNELAAQGSIPMTEISEKLHITKPAVTHLVDQLEKKKLLKRIAHASDRRISLLKVETKGKKMVRCIQATILRFLLSTLDQFNAKEKAVITRFYGRLSQTVDEILKKFEEAPSCKK